MRPTRFQAIRGANGAAGREDWNPHGSFRMGLPFKMMGNTGQLHMKSKVQVRHGGSRVRGPG